MSFFSPVLVSALYVIRCHRNFVYFLLFQEKTNPNFTAKYTLQKLVCVFHRQLMPMDCKKILHVYQKLSATYLCRSFLIRVNLFGNICYPLIYSDLRTIQLLEKRSWKSWYTSRVLITFTVTFIQSVKLSGFYSTYQNFRRPQIKKVLYSCMYSGFGGLGVACWPLVPKFAISNPAETVGFLRAKKSSARPPSEGK